MYTYLLLLLIFTSGDDFAQAFSGRGTIPSSVAELILTFFSAQLGSFDDLLQNLRLLAADFRFSTAHPPALAA